MPETFIVIPTYNERENISVLIREIFQVVSSVHVLVVDDNSPDGTADVVRQIQHSEPYGEQVHLVVRPFKAGLGKAYIHGFQWVLQNFPGVQILLEMDADRSHRPEDIPRLLQPIQAGRADVVIGSRYVSGGRVVNWPRKRIWLSRAASIYVRFWTWMPIQDPTAGFVAYCRRVLETIPFQRIPFSGYAFQIAIKYLAWRCGFILQEVPITFVERVEGGSKMNRQIVWEAILGVPRLPFSKQFQCHDSPPSSG